MRFQPNAYFLSKQNIQSTTGTEAIFSPILEVITTSWAAPATSFPGVLETTNAAGDVVFLDGGNTPPAELAERWRTLHLSQSFLPKEDEVRIGESYSVTYGDSGDINDYIKLGFITAFSQSSGDNTNTTDVSNPVFPDGFLRDDYSRGVDTSAFLSGAISLGENHTVKATYFDKHAVKDTVTRGSNQNDGSSFGVLTGLAVFDIFGGDAVYNRGFWDISSTSRDLKIIQLQGNHQLSERGLKFDWSITDSKANETRPYSTFFSFGELNFSEEALAPFTEAANRNLFDTFSDALISSGIPFDPAITTFAELRPIIVGLTSEEFVRDQEISAGLPRIAPGGTVNGQSVVNTVVFNQYTGSAEGSLPMQRRFDVTREDALDQQASFTMPFYFDDENDERLFEVRAGATSFSKTRSISSRVYDLTLRSDAGAGSGFPAGSLTTNGLAEELAANPDRIADFFNGTIIGCPTTRTFLERAVWKTLPRSSTSLPGSSMAGSNGTRPFSPEDSVMKRKVTRSGSPSRRRFPRRFFRC